MTLTWKHGVVASVVWFGLMMVWHGGNYAGDNGQTAIFGGWLVIWGAVIGLGWLRR